jgi:hypothetical protein
MTLNWFQDCTAAGLICSIQDYFNDFDPQGIIIVILPLYGV